MKKYFILFSILLIFFVVGISSASDDNELVYKADKLIKKADETGWVDRAVCFSVQATAIYSKLIYQEEKKQTKMLEQIMKKLNIKEVL